MKKLFLTIAIILIIGLSVPVHAATAKVFSILHGTTFNTLTDAQMETLAENYDLVATSQYRYNVDKANANATQLKGYNSDIELYTYGNARTVRPSGPQFDDCDGDEDLFSHYTDCEPSCDSDDRIHTIFGSLLMAPSNTDWTDQIVQWYSELNSDFDGLFMDVCLDSISRALVIEGRPYGYTAEAWKTNMDINIESVKSQLGSTLVFCNGIRDWYIDNDFGSTINGWMLENGFLGVKQKTVDHDYIEEGVNSALDAAAAGKRVFVAPKDKEGFTTAERIFVLACHFLAYHPTYSYYILGDEDDFNTLRWYPEYEIDIGAPIGTPANMATLLDSNLYVRKFSRGLVIVNTSADTNYNYTLTKSYSSLTVTGGGEVAADGSLPAGQIIKTHQPAGQVTVNAGTALILRILGPSKVIGFRVKEE